MWLNLQSKLCFHRQPFSRNQRKNCQLFILMWEVSIYLVIDSTDKQTYVSWDTFSTWILVRNYILWVLLSVPAACHGLHFQNRAFKLLRKFEMLPHQSCKIVFYIFPKTQSAYSIRINDMVISNCFLDPRLIVCCVSWTKVMNKSGRPSPVTAEVGQINLL